MTFDHFEVILLYYLIRRGFKEEDFRTVADLLDQAVLLAKEAQSSTKNLKEFSARLDKQDLVDKCSQLKTRVNEFASSFPMPGFEDH